MHRFPLLSRVLAPVLLACLFAGPPLLAAGGGGGEPMLREVKLLLPRYQLEKGGGPGEPVVHLAAGEYDALKHAIVEAGRSLREEELRRSSPRVLQVEASFEGDIHRSRADLKGTLVYEVLTGRPVDLPVAGPGSILRSVEVLGGPEEREGEGRIRDAAWLHSSREGGALALRVRGEGTWSVAVELTAPLTRQDDEVSLDLALPAFSVSPVILHHDGPLRALSVRRGGPARIARGPGEAESRRLSVSADPGGHLELSWFSTVREIPAVEAELAAAGAKGTREVVPSPGRGEHVSARERDSGAGEGDPSGRSSSLQDEGPPLLEADVQGLFTLGEDRADVSYLVEVVATRGHLREVVLAAPPSVAVAHVAGPLIRSWAAPSAHPGELRVSLEEPLRGVTTLLVEGTMSLPPEGALELPMVEVPGASGPPPTAGVSTFAALGTVPRGTNVREVPQSSLHGLLQERMQAPLRHLCQLPRGETSLALDVTRLDRIETVPILVDNANAVTILGDSGKAAAGSGPRTFASITKIVYQVQNTSRSHLTMTLPAGAHLSGCFVGTRAVTPLRDGRNDTYRIPLLRSAVRGGEMEAFPVQVTYELDIHSAREWVGSLSSSLPVLDAAMSDVSWKVFTPEGFRFVHFDGNLRVAADPEDFVLVALARWMFLLGIRRVLPGFLVLVLGWLLIRTGLRVLFRRGGTAAGASGRTGLRAGLAMAAGGLAVTGILVALAVPNFRSARIRSNVRACYANQKTLAGAVEMYNLDYNTYRRRLDRSFLGRLVEDGYLQTLPRDPGGGGGSWSHYLLDAETGQIRCRVHGGLPGGARVFGHDPAPPSPQGGAAQGPDPDPDPGAGAETVHAARIAPINVRIPRTAQYTLLVRQLLPEGERVHFRVRYSSRRLYDLLGTLAFGLTALLGALFMPGAGASHSAVRDHLVLFAFLGLLVSLDALDPALAMHSGRGALAGLIAMPLLLTGRRLLRTAAGGLSVVLVPIALTCTLIASPSILQGASMEVPLYWVPGGVEDGGVLLPLSTYRSLLRASQPGGRDSAEVEAEPVYLTSASYTVVPSGRTARIEARLQGIKERPGWELLPWPASFGETAVESARAGGRPLSFEDDRPALRQPGPFRIDLVLRAPVTRHLDTCSLTMALPGSPLNRIEIVGADGRPLTDVELHGGVLLDARVGHLPRGAPLQLSWKTDDRSPAPAAFAGGQEGEKGKTSPLTLPGRRGNASFLPRIEGTVLGRVQRGRLVLDASLVLVAGDQPLTSAEIDWPGTARIRSVDGPEGMEWTAEPSLHGQRLNLSFGRPLLGRGDLRLELRSQAGEAGIHRLASPSVVGAPRRSPMLLALEGSDTHDLRVLEAPSGWRELDRSAAPDSILKRTGRPLVALYRTAEENDGRPGPAGATPPEVTATGLKVKVTALERTVMRAALADLARAETVLLADGVCLSRMVWFVKNNTEPFLRIGMPEGTRLLTAFVSRAAVIPARGSGTTLLIPLQKSGVKDAQAAAFPVELTWMQRMEAPRNGSRLRLELPGIHVPTGTVRWDVSAPGDLVARVEESNLRVDEQARPVEEPEGASSLRQQGLRLFQQSRMPLRVHLPETSRPPLHLSVDLVDGGAPRPRVELRLESRQSRRVHRALAFAVAMLLAFALAAHGNGRRSVWRRVLALVVLSGVTVALTSFHPESLGLGLHFSLGLLLGALLCGAREAVFLVGE